MIDWDKLIQKSREVVLDAFGIPSDTQTDTHIDWEAVLAKFPHMEESNSYRTRLTYSERVESWRDEQAAYQLALSLPEIRRLIGIMIDTGFGESARPLLSILDMIDDLLTRWVIEKKGMKNKIPPQLDFVNENGKPRKLVEGDTMYINQQKYIYKESDCSYHIYTDK